MPNIPTPRGYSGSGGVNLDWLGIFYICLACLHTIIIFSGLIVLWLKRHTRMIRLRSFYLTTGSTLLIHFYVTFLIVVYPLNGKFKCSWEFWIMSIFLPFSMAIYQATNARLLSLYREQKQFAHVYIYGEKFLSKTFASSSSITSSLPVKFLEYRVFTSELSHLHKTYLGIFIALLLQVALTAFLFFSSRKFHPNYGLFPPSTALPHPSLLPLKCRQGLEWIPSVFWQFLWSSFFGPFLLLNYTRHIHDIHYWSLQIKITILLMLPGTPLWLFFLYTSNYFPIIAKINLYFVPASWFLPGLISIQYLSIFFPLYFVYFPPPLSSASTHSTSSSSTTSSFPHRYHVRHSSSSSTIFHPTTTSRDLYSMASLELQISRNIEPLLKWTAEKDFTVENILFLKAVRDFKQHWTPLMALKFSLDQLRSCYTHAALIFFNLVNPISAPFYINIDHHRLKLLKSIFNNVTFYYNQSPTKSPDLLPNPNPNTNPVTPWDTSPSTQSPLPPVQCQSISTLSASILNSFLIHCNADNITIPDSFSIHIFDSAYDSVKDDVFRNTWARYEEQFARPKCR